MNVNAEAIRHWEERVAGRLERLRVERHPLESGASLIDWGCETAGGLEAGVLLSELCLGGLGSVQLVGGGVVGSGVGASRLDVEVRTDHPVAACLASQYAGWPISVGKYFAMGSGPIRAARGKEKMLLELGLEATSSEVLGVLEARRLPSDEVCCAVAAEAGVAPTGLILNVARTASLAGTIQIVARSIETALHQLHELGFDLGVIQSAWGRAALPPVPPKDLTAMGWTNDSILYDAQVTLWVETEDDLLAEIGPQVPSSASDDFGRPFLEIFESCGHDFYKIDPRLFSPAQITLINRASGREFTFGERHPEIFARSLQAGSA